MDESAKAAWHAIQASALDRLRGTDSSRWPHIAAARSLSGIKFAEIAEVARDLLPRGEGSLVVFGSLARGEFTVGSDLDWTILVDGRADSNHLKIVHSLNRKLQAAGFKVPGPTEVFGGLVFSHDLIHAIGGDEDTNKNMTRRLLLLLESASISASESNQVHDRVVSGILYRYVEEDASFISGHEKKDRIPRFLLNDVVRFWRTMAVDYANKYRSRESVRWALRNIKLRMSRKLLFISGLFMCISWALNNLEAEDHRFLPQDLVVHLRDWTRRPPLESLATIVETHAPSLTGEIFDNYDLFLDLLSDDRKRTRLENLKPDQAYKDDLFLEIRHVAAKFDAALIKLLFGSNDEITRLAQKYGIF
jgi:predicted nucleotidyltransferase